MPVSTCKLPNPSAPCESAACCWRRQEKRREGIRHAHSVESWRERWQLYAAWGSLAVTICSADRLHPVCMRLASQPAFRGEVLDSCLAICRDRA